MAVEASGTATTAPTAAADGGEAASGRSPNRTEATLIGLFGAVASQVALLTALLYYVGWARSHATLGCFGIDPALVGYSTADYVLRSLTATFVPVIVVALVGLGAFVLHHELLRPVCGAVDRWCGGWRMDRLPTRRRGCGCSCFSRWSW